MNLFGRLASERTGFTPCVQPSFEKDGEALGKFLQFVMRGLGGLLDCLGAQHHVVCPVCVPPGRGDSL